MSSWLSSNVMNESTVNSTNNNKSKNGKVMKLFTLPSDLFEVVDFRGMDVVEEPKVCIPRFIIGEYYSLGGIACDGFEMKEKIYELVGVIDEYQGTQIDSVIVKQVGGEQGKIFTLSKNDCAYLNIEYEKGLQLFPKNLPWKLVKYDIPFDSMNLGTNPLSNVDNTIRHILIRIDGFKDYSDGYVLTPSGRLITEESFEKTLRIQTVEPIVYGNGFIKKDRKRLNTKIVYPKNLLYNHGNFISCEDTIYVLIDLSTTKISNSNESTNLTIDGLYGVEKDYLEGINPNEFFEISWDELAAPTVEEYEEEKARKERELEEAIKREEEMRRKAESEKKERVNKAVERMKAAKPKKVKFPRYTYTTQTNSISSIDMLAENLDMYFNKLGNSLDDLGRELSGLYDDDEMFMPNKAHSFNSIIKSIRRF